MRSREVGLLTRGSSYSLPLPRALGPSVLVQLSSPLTVAGPCRIHAGFPVHPERILDSNARFSRTVRHH